jgi:glycosyltransferase involved in cell wall biosynthesis
MKIVIDGRMLYWTGVGRYTKALLDHLALIDKTNDYVVITRNQDRHLWKPASDSFRQICVDINPYTLGEQTRLTGVLNGLNPDLVHFTAANTPMAYRGARVVTVHDLTLLFHDTGRGGAAAQALRKLKRRPFRTVLARSVRAAETVITPSEYVKKQLETHFHTPREKIRVIPLASDLNLIPPAPIERLQLGGPFILFVGTVYPYKNVGLILDAMQLLRTSHPNLRLVLTSRPDFFRDALWVKAQSMELQDRLVFTDFVSDAELVSLYRQAAMYVYPSFSEGFGLQGLEAMTLGLPVLAAQKTSLPEVCGNAADYFDPHNVHDLAKKIDVLLTNPEYASDLVKRGYGRAKLFSWEKMARQTLDVYETAAKR